MRYSARFAEEAWNRTWTAESNVRFGPEGALVTTFSGDCILRERVAGGRSRQAAVLMEVLLRQARHVERCAEAPRDTRAFQRRIGSSLPHLRRMLDRLREASGRGEKALRSAAEPRANLGNPR